MERLLRIPEACKLLGIGKSALYAWIRAGRIKPIRLPTGKYRIPLSELDRVIAEANPDTKITFVTLGGNKQ